MSKRLVISHIDTCLPGYFAGSPHPTLAVPLTSLTTREEVMEELVHEFRTLDDTVLPDIESDHFEAQINEDFANAFGGDLSEPFDPRIQGSDDEDADMIYAYFIVTTEEL